MSMLAPRWDAAEYLANSTGSGNPDKAGAATCDNYSQGGARECDEHPFRSTLEGAAEHDFDPDAKKFNFSVQPVKESDNGKVGLLLKSYYAKNRILADTEDDSFFVKITN
ncbi:NucA/NucB deoxyribonuclease domain-containing protein [Streptomyces atriruber]|uniref:NucA/NucB deoxyribonuclease domain-containing protein n=1 Tax=Streptomyces atriruber TaxID=545121 RepID=UPI000B0CE061|nr:hypothetical protein [Streptomyces atriruber]